MAVEMTGSVNANDLATIPDPDHVLVIVHMPVENLPGAISEVITLRATRETVHVVMIVSERITGKRTEAMIKDIGITRIGAQKDLTGVEEVVALEEEAEQVALIEEENTQEDLTGRMSAVIAL